MKEVTHPVDVRQRIENECVSHTCPLPWPGPSTSSDPAHDPPDRPAARHLSHCRSGQAIDVVLHAESSAAAG